MRFILLIFLILSMLSCSSHRKAFESLKLPPATPEGQGLVISSLGTCNASLITPTTLLTNSHCLTKTSADKIYGIIKTPGADTFVSFKRILFQSKFIAGHDYQSANPDYAILELETPIESVKPLIIKRTEFKDHQPVFLHSLELHDDMSITLQSSKCFTFKNNWDSDFKMGLRNVFIYQGTGKEKDCIVKEGYSGSALKNEQGEMIGVLRQLENQKIIEGRKQGNLGIATSMSCLKLFDAELDKARDPRCDSEQPYDRKKEFIENLKITLDKEIELQMQSLPKIFGYSVHTTKDETDPKVLIYKTSFRMQPDCIHKDKLAKGIEEGELWDLQVQVGITFDKIKGFGFKTPTSIKIPYPYSLRKVKGNDFDFVIDTPYVKGQPMPYCS